MGNDMNGYQKYKEKSIYSMSSSELLLLLYDESIKRLTRAEHALEDKNYTVFDDCIVRTSKIIRYLIDILDMEQPISRDLRRIYDYLIFDLSKVKAGRDREKEEIGRIRHIISELRDAFDEAGRKVNDTRMVHSNSVLG